MSLFIRKWCKAVLLLFAGCLTASAFASERVNRELFLLSIDKSMLQAKLMTWPENFRQAQLLRSFDIAIGKADGDKQSEGDNRTPEGIYFTQSHIDGRDLPEKYGPRAIPLDYPNVVDRWHRKTGYGIWLHGVDNETRIEAQKVTEGCIAFHNSDIEILRNWLPPYQAIVVIAGNSSEINRPQDLESVRSQTLAWYHSWKQRHLDGYIEVYSEKFRHPKASTIRSFKRYKRSVFGAYKHMEVEISDLRIITHPKYAVSVMNQEFNGDNRYQSIGRKTLYWTRNGQGEWKILREVFSSRRLRTVEFTDEEIAALSAARREGQSSNL